MANFRGTQGLPDRKTSRNLIFDEFVPSSGWTEDSNCHYLLIDLPEFKTEEVKLHLDEHGHILVSGERKVSENKYKIFEQRFKVPENTKIDKISGKFEGGIIYVIVPKEEVIEEHENNTSNGVFYEEAEEERPKEDENLENKRDENKRIDEKEEEKEKEKEKEKEETLHKANAEKWGYDHEGTFGNVMKKFSKNKGIIITAVLAFSLGVYVTQKIQSNGQ